MVIVKNNNALKNINTKPLSTLIKGATNLNGNKKILVIVLSDLFRFLVFFFRKSSIFDKFILNPDIFIF